MTEAIHAYYVTFHQWPESIDVLRDFTRNRRDVFFAKTNRRSDEGQAKPVIYFTPLRKLYGTYDSALHAVQQRWDRRAMAGDLAPELKAGPGADAVTNEVARDDGPADSQELDAG